MSVRKLVLYILLPLFAVVLLLTACSVVAVMLLDESPITAQIATSPDFIPMMTGMRTIQENIRSAVKQGPGTERTLELTEREFNALLAGSIGNPFTASFLRIPEEMKRGRLELENGIFIFLYPYDIGRDTPFGRFLNLRCRFRFSIDGGRATVTVLECKAGAFSVPRGRVQEFVERKMKECYFRKPVEQVVREGVVSWRTERERAILCYRPFELIEAADRVWNPDGSRKIRRTLEKIAR